MSDFTCYCGVKTEFTVGLDVTCCECNSIYTCSPKGRGFKYSCDRVDDRLPAMPSIHSSTVGGITSVTFAEEQFIDE